MLVYDLGGGTFDATLLRLSPGKIETIATDGDVQLGGHDWDLRLVDHLADRFRKLHKRDPRQDPVPMNRMLAAAIDAKHALSARGRTTVRVELAGQVMEIPVSREQFEEMTADLLERTAYTTRQLLTAAADGVEGHYAGAVGGRIDADADGRRHAAEPERPGAGPHGAIPTRRWPAAPPSTPPTCWPRSRATRTARVSRSPTSTRTAWAWRGSTRRRCGSGTWC